MDKASPELKSIRSSLSRIDGEIATAANRFVASHSDSVVDSIVTMRNGRAVILVKASDKNMYGGLLHGCLLYTSTGGWKMPPVRAALINMLFINLLLNFLPNISVHAHLGGFVTGLMMYGIITTDKAEVHKRVNYGVALVGLIGVLCFISWQNRAIPTRSRYLGTDLNVLQKMCIRDRV